MIILVKYENYKENEKFILLKKSKLKEDLSKCLDDFVFINFLYRMLEDQRSDLRYKLFRLLREDGFNKDVKIMCSGGMTAKPNQSLLDSADISESDMEAIRNEKYYECVFSEDVVIEYGAGLVVSADDKIVINNILWSDEDETETESGDTAKTNTSTTKKNGR